MKILRKKMSLPLDRPFSASLAPQIADKRVLYHGILCPLSRQIRLGLLEKGVPFKLKEEKVGRPSEDLYGLNLEGSLPVLEEGQGVFVKSYAIIEYLEEAYPDVNLMGATYVTRSEVRRLVDWFAHKFYEDVTVALLYEKIFKRIVGQGGPDSQILKEGRARLHDHLEYIGWLFDRRKWLGGDFFSWADITAAAQLSCLDYLGDVPWNKHANAKDWYTRIKSRPTFRPFLQEMTVEALPSPHYRLLDF